MMEDDLALARALSAMPTKSNSDKTSSIDDSRKNYSAKLKEKKAAFR